MSTYTYAVKFLRFIITLRNPFLFIYRTFHYLNKFVPKGLASYIYRKNQKDYQREGVQDYLLETYDGSGQAVHPDIVFWKNKYWLTITPYPYGMEEYENPCIYHGDNLESLFVPKGPIAVQHKHTQGIHLSDPCFAINGDKLYCYFRESERKGSVEKNTIWGISYSETEKKWGNPVLLMDSLDDKILSPAMMYNETGDLIVYYVSTLNDKYALVSTQPKGVVKKIIEHRIIGVPNDYFLWHMGISKVKDIQPSFRESKALIGLFLMRSRNLNSGMKLFEASNNGVETDWYIVKAVDMPDAIKCIISFPYKSCYIPKGNGAIILSFRDKKNRNRLLVINNSKILN